MSFPSRGSSATRVDLRDRDPREPIGLAVLPTIEADAVVLQTDRDDYWGESAYFDHPFLKLDGGDGAPVRAVARTDE